MESGNREFFEDVFECIDPKDYETADDYFDELDVYSYFNRDGETDAEFRERVYDDAVEFWNEKNKS